MRVRVTRGTHGLRRFLAVLVSTLALLWTTSLAPALATQGWTPPVDVSTLGGFSGGGARLAVSGNTWIAAWLWSDGTTVMVQAARSTDGGASWSAPVTLSNPGESASEPAVAITGNGAVITWPTHRGSEYIIEASSSADGGITWGSAVDISVVGGAGQDALRPKAALSGSAWIIAWDRFDGNDWRVQATRSANGGTSWSSPTNLSLPGNSAFGAEVISSGGASVVTWQRFDGTDYRAQAARSTDGGASWSTPTNLSFPGGNADPPQLACSGTTWVSTWTLLTAGHDIVQASRSTDNGATWSSPVTVSATPDNATFPEIATSGDAWVVTWYRTDGTHATIQAIHSSDTGATWSSAVDISAPSELATNPEVSGQGGNWTITWRGYNGLFFVISASTSVDGGDSWSPPQPLSADGFDSDRPGVAVSGGISVVSWGRSDGTHRIIQASSFIFPQASDALAASRSMFTYSLPDGTECGSINPQIVINGTSVQLPGPTAECRTPGSVIIGWRIPGQSWAFGPSSIVTAVDSQRFTAVLREPVVRIILDANVAAHDDCSHEGRDITVDRRTSSLYLERTGMSRPGHADQPSLDTYPAPSEAPCAPAGYHLTSWNSHPDGTGIFIALGAPVNTAVSATDNTIPLFAQWHRNEVKR